MIVILMLIVLVYVTVNLYNQVICILSEIYYQVMCIQSQLAIDVLPEYFR